MDACTGSLDAGGDAGRDAGVIEQRDAATPRDAQPLDCPAADTRGLAFDGVRDHVSMGPTLGLARFAVEAWVRPDGAGVTAATGSGGLQLVPIATKGRAESDGSNVDCNYALGYVGDVLAPTHRASIAGRPMPTASSRSRSICLASG